ncbi:MAG TPA: pyrroline-5-carboxylate reductase [Campylobacteraceae bacterium]|jgi:pyrroline-5-carboxylate reductase|nr:pyrroline-5-carboxylate reductase [Campylobacteraceae bacterium]HHD83672.1 pyrroline-5-carboxylate reductase [Campylobacteraceae bacterium]
MQRRLTIIGSGSMAGAIIRGVAGRYPVEVVAREGERLEKLCRNYGGEITVTTLQEGLDIAGKRIIMAVKPYAFDAVAKMLKGRAEAHLSVMAGVPLEHLKSRLDAAYTVRAMPNLAAKYGKSMTTLCGDEGFREAALQICNAFGEALWLGSEKEIDIATAIAGSGPAYLALIAEALADGGVKAGLKREDAQKITQGLFTGMGDLLQMHPALLKDAVMSPGGTTAAGYGALEAGAVRKSFIEAVEAAFDQAKKVGGGKTAEK